MGGRDAIEVVFEAYDTAGSSRKLPISELKKTDLQYKCSALIPAN